MEKNPKVSLKFGDESMTVYCDIECSVCGSPIEYTQDNWTTCMLTLRINPCQKCISDAIDERLSSDAMIASEYE